MSIETTDTSKIYKLKVIFCDLTFTGKFQTKHVSFLCLEPEIKYKLSIIRVLGITDEQVYIFQKQMIFVIIG